MVNCRVCKEKLIEGENWYPAFKKTNSKICNKCSNQYSKDYRLLIVGKWFWDYPYEDNCIYCNCELIVGINWVISNKNTNKRECKECHTIHARNWKRKNILGTTDENGNVLKIRCIKREYTNKCELCGKVYEPIPYHHWDDENPQWGLWLCYACHRFVEAFEKGYNDNDLNKYIELKRMVESGKI